MTPEQAVAILTSIMAAQKGDIRMTGGGASKGRYFIRFEWDSAPPSNTEQQHPVDSK